jgi:hypothetical protein
MVQMIKKIEPNCRLILEYPFLALIALGYVKINGRYDLIFNA